MFKAKVSKTFNLILSILIIFLSYGFIYIRLFYDKKNNDLLSYFNKFFSDVGLFLVVLFLLMFLNWLLEARKWQYLLRKKERISLISSLIAVFSGITVSIFTPNRIGEYIGRIFMLKKTHPIQGALITILGSISQLVVTLIFGSLSALIFILSFTDYLDPYPHFIKIALVFVVIIAVLLILSIYFNLTLLYNATDRIKFKWLIKFRRYLKIIANFSNKELLHTLLLSFFRYLVFSFQFYILLYWMGICISFFDGFVLISLIFFVMAAVPTIALSELGVRGSVAVFLWEIYASHSSVIYSDDMSINVVAASAILWIVNLMIPAIIGSVFVFRLNFFNRNYSKT
ncbi:MAG: lysylphosphatidylglycerol synthase domain-containing protein [Bacteroidota bacterium]